MLWWIDKKMSTKKVYITVLGRFTHTNAFWNAETTTFLYVSFEAISKWKKIVWIRHFQSFYFWILRRKHVKNISTRFSQLSPRQSWSNRGSNTHENRAFRARITENENPSLLKPAYGKYGILCRYVRKNWFWLCISIVKTCIKVCMSLIWLIQSPLPNYSPGDFMKMRVFQENDNPSLLKPAYGK